MSFESDGSVDEKKRGELNSFLFEFKGCQLLLVEEMRMRNDASSPEIHPYSSKVGPCPAIPFLIDDILDFVLLLRLLFCLSFHFIIQLLSQKEDSSASKVEAAAGTSGKSAKIDKDALDVRLASFSSFPCHLTHHSYIHQHTWNFIRIPLIPALYKYCNS